MGKSSRDVWDVGMRLRAGPISQRMWLMITLSPGIGNPNPLLSLQPRLLQILRQKLR